jgi:hypothetical protein
MAKTVAEIDGDSSGLVGSLDKAKVAMGKVGDSSKKLSDQLKEVGDQADIAAGNLVNKLGGPNAIKAIGGATIAFAAAQQGVQMFLDSSEKLFRAYGDKGQAVWDDLEKQLFDIQGAFAKAVLQTDDMYVAAGRLYAALELVKDMSDQAVTAFIGAINILRNIPGTSVDMLEKMGFFEAFDAMAQEGEARARELTANMDKVGKSFEKPVERAKTLTETVDAMATAYAGLTKSSVSLEEQNRKAALENIDNTVKQVEALALLQNMADNMSGDNVGGLTDKQLEDMERLGKLRQEIVDGGKTPAAPAATGSGKGGKKDGEKEETVAEMVARVGAKHVAYAQLAEEAALLKIENDKTEQQMELDRLRTELDNIEKHNAEKLAAEQRFLDFAAKMEQDHIEEIHARGELTDEEKDARDAERLQAVKDRAGEEMGIYMQTAGKQIALGKLSAKAAADMARSQLGNVIIGLGDKAMAEAGILAAGLNPMAIPMAAAGVTAYAIGNAMMPTAKPTGTTPATEKAEASAPAATNNYAFNMRVDSVFADGESVARQFAMMQESARQRGLLMQGV